jgi:glycogen debranching enzyme
MVSIAAERLGFVDDAKRYASIAANVSQAFNNHFYDASNYTYVVCGNACREVAWFQASIGVGTKPRGH